MIINNIRKKGFTLIEILLIVFFIGLTFLGIYMMQSKTSDEVTISKEKEYILTLFDEIDRSASVLSKFQDISLQSLKDNGYIAKTNGFELVSVNAPTPTRLEATYNNLKNKECSMFVSSIVNFSETYSAKINNIVIPSKADPKNITLECSNDLNEVVIVRENNVFGVALNTSLNGVNNPITGQNINACPVGVCNTMIPVTPVPFTPITVAVNKPTVTIPGAITKPTFTPGTPMVQPPIVPPVVTPPLPPVLTPPIVTPVTPTNPTRPTTPVTPPVTEPEPTPTPTPTTPVVTPPAGSNDPYQNYPKTFNVICNMNCENNIVHQNFRPQIDSVIVNPVQNNITTARADLLVPDNMIPNYIGFKIVGSSTGGNTYNYDFLELKSLGYKFYVYQYLNGNGNSYVGQGFGIYLCKNNSCPWPPQDY